MQASTCTVREAYTARLVGPKMVPIPVKKKPKGGYLPMFVQATPSTCGAVATSYVQAGFSGYGAKHHGRPFTEPNCGSMSTVVVQYDFNVSGVTASPTRSPRTMAALFTKLAGSSGEAKSGTVTVQSPRARYNRAASTHFHFVVRPTATRLCPPRLLSEWMQP